MTAVGTGPDDRREPIATLAPLPLTFAAVLMGAVDRVSEAFGWRTVRIGDGLRISGLPPAPGTQPDVHLIEITAGEQAQALLGWRCSCPDTTGLSHADLGRAVSAAIRHVPAGEPWWIVPGRGLIRPGTAAA